LLKTKDLAAALITAMSAPNNFFNGAKATKTPKTTCLRPGKDGTNGTGSLSSNSLTSQTHTQVVRITADLFEIIIGDVDFFSGEGKKIRTSD
jgi:hypothetical protein